MYRIVYFLPYFFCFQPVLFGLRILALVVVHSPDAVQTIRIGGAFPAKMMYCLLLSKLDNRKSLAVFALSFQNFEHLK